MNTNVKKLITTLAGLTAACALALTAVFSSPVSVARAESRRAGEGGGPFGDGSGLEFACRQMERMLAGQQDRLTFSQEIADKTQLWIDRLKSEGKDTAGLEAALAAFNTALDTAQTQHDEAQSAFDTHAGFNGNSCQVSDREQARETLREARAALREAQRTLRDASDEFRRAVKEWRQANRPAALTTAP